MLTQKDWKQATGRWVLTNWDTVLTLCISMVCAVLGLSGIIGTNVLASATLATLTMLCVSMVRDRWDRTHNDPVGASLDDLLSNRSPERPLLDDAKHEVMLVQETGSKFVEECKDALLQFLANGGTVKMVITMPCGCTSASMAFRNSSLDQTAIERRSDSFRDHMAGLVRAADSKAERLHVRYVPYPVETTCLLVDPDTPRGIGMVRFAGFKIPFDRKLDFELTANLTPRTLNHYVDEFRSLFRHSSKVVLLEGLPRSGKTTMLTAVAQRIGNHPRVWYALCPAVGSREERKGFNLSTKDEHARAQWATPDGDTYSVDHAVLSYLAQAVRCASVEHDIIILDEIGPLQLLNADFQDAVLSLLDNPRLTLVASIPLIADENPLVKQVKRHYRSSIITLDSANRDAVLSDIYAEITPVLEMPPLTKGITL